MLKTPTYHVFDLYKEHQGGESVYCYADKLHSYEEVPLISSSASVKEDKMTITLTNTSISDEAAVEIDIAGFTFSKASDRILTDEVHAYNDFDNPERVGIKDREVKAEGSRIALDIPACAVVCITLEA